MERPLSMMGSSSTHSTTASMHKRNVSAIKSLPKSQSTSATSLFVTNLKLLNFDLLPDWPNLSTLSFSSVDSRSRIRSTEWSLYQLFRRFDPQMTAEKLQPFFPPLEHLQSINLRAALHRCLNDLKKNGVLGRDSILRKTMLDECSGEKFWELCLSFSNVVLRKATLEYRPRHVQPLARRYATSQITEKKEKESLLPMAIAHKAALTKVLTTKTRKRESFMRLSSLMAAKEDELLVRLDAIEAAKPVAESPAHAEELEAIEEALCHSSFGDAAIMTAVVNGDHVRPGDMLLLQSRHDFLDQLDSSSQSRDDRRESSVLDDLQRKANSQRARVGQWQALYDQLRTRKTSKSEDLVATVLPQTLNVSFDRHHELNFEDAQRPSPVPVSHPEPVPSYISRYDEILTTMREELRRAQKARRENTGRSNRPVPEQKPSITLDAVAGARNLSLSRTSSRRSISPTIPFRPGLGRRVSSRPRSYQQPRVVSQREPIPFKSEVFSPISTASSGDISPARSNGSAREHTPTTPSQETTKPTNANRESQGSMGTKTVDSGIGLGVDLTASPVEARDDVEDNISISISVPDHSSITDITDTVASRSTKSSRLPSLSERTRLSMAVGKGDPDPRTSSAEDYTSPVKATVDEKNTLANRTRMSMSAFNLPLPICQPSPATKVQQSQPIPAISLAKTRMISAQTISSTHEADERCDEVSALSVATHDDDRVRRNITPREKLFDADAEASSVFKSRPKIATSPVLSPAPARDSIGDDTTLDN